MLNQESYDKIKNYYWVCVEEGKRPAYWWSWKVGDKPLPPPNKSMRWRRPTFIEAELKQRAFDDNIKNYFDACSRWNDYTSEIVVRQTNNKLTFWKE